MPTNADNFILTGLLHALFHCLPVLNQHYQTVVFAFIHDCITFKTQTSSMKMQHEKNISEAAKVIFPVFAQYLRVTRDFYNSPSFPKNASGCCICLGTCDEGYTRYYCGRAFGAELGIATDSNGDDELASVTSFNTALIALYSSSEMTQCGPDSGLQCQECRDYTASSKLISALVKKEAEEEARAAAAEAAAADAAKNAAVKKKTFFFGGKGGKGGGGGGGSKAGRRGGGTNKRPDFDKRASLGATSLSAAAFADLATHDSGIFFCGKALDVTNAIKKKCTTGSAQCEECVALQALEVSRSVTRNYASHILQVLRVIVKESAAKCLDEYDSLHDDVISLTKGPQANLKLEACFVVFSAIESLGQEVGIYVQDFLPVLELSLTHKARKVRECASVTCGILARHVNSAFKEEEIRVSFTKCLLRAVETFLHQKATNNFGARFSCLHKTHQLVKRTGADSLNCQQCQLPISNSNGSSSGSSSGGGNGSSSGVRSGLRGLVGGGKHKNDNSDGSKLSRTGFCDEYWYCDFCLYTLCADCCDKNDYKEMLSNCKTKSVALDILVGSLSTLLQSTHNPNQDSIALSLPLILSAMPLQGDVSENRSVVNFLVALLDHNDPHGIQHINRIAGIFNQLLKGGASEGIIGLAEKNAIENCLKTHADKIDINSMELSLSLPLKLPASAPNGSNNSNSNSNSDSKSGRSGEVSDVEMTNINSHSQPKAANDDDTLNPMLSSNSPFSSRKGRVSSSASAASSTFDPSMQAPLANCGSCCTVS